MPDLTILRKQALRRLRSAILEVRRLYCTGCRDAADCKCKFYVIQEAASKLLEDASYEHDGGPADEA